MGHEHPSLVCCFHYTFEISILRPPHCLFGNHHDSFLLELTLFSYFVDFEILDKSGTQDKPNNTTVYNDTNSTDMEGESTQKDRIARDISVFWTKLPAVWFFWYDP